MIIAVDFDYTLCYSKYPECGEPISRILNLIKKYKTEGHKIILWTCREDEPLKKAVDWCESYGLTFDAVNSNLPECIEMFGNDSRKIFADVYIDDRAKELSNATMIYDIYIKCAKRRFTYEQYGLSVSNHYK